VDKKIALFGGTFDPPTIAHQFVAQTAYAEGDVDEVWFLPCYGHQLEKKPIASPWDRWQMCQLLAENLGSPFSVCDFEVRTQSKGKMYETLASLKEEMKKIFGFNFQFLPVIGSDCANELESKWFNGKQLIEEYQFIVFVRGGCLLNCDWVKPPHKLIDLNYNYSSSLFKETIKSGNTTLAKKHINPKLHSSINRIYKDLK